MNLLPPEKLQAVEKCFNEGRGIRETERLTGVHRDTVSRYFRLFAVSPIEAEDDTGKEVTHFEVIESDDGNWNVFCWNDATPEWWRHLAMFHSWERAFDYSGWCEYLSEDRESPHPKDEAPAPSDLPAPPAGPSKDGIDPYTKGWQAVAERSSTKAERAAAAERRQDELAAALPPRYCAVCEIQLTRRPHEPVNNFKVRKTCSHEHAQQLIRDRAGAAQSAEAAEEPPAAESQTAEALDDAVAEPELLRDGEGDPLEGTPIPLAAAAEKEDDRPTVTPPGFKDCPDCLWSGPVTDYRFHRQTDHAA